MKRGTRDRGKSYLSYYSREERKKKKKKEKVKYGTGMGL
jgi:hypothetical protein